MTIYRPYMYVLGLAYLCELDTLAGHVDVVEVHKVCELVMAPDVGVVGGERHQEVDQGHDHQHAGRRGDHEVQLGVLQRKNKALK